MPQSKARNCDACGRPFFQPKRRITETTCNNCKIVADLMMNSAHTAMFVTQSRFVGEQVLTRMLFEIDPNILSSGTEKTDPYVSSKTTKYFKNGSRLCARPINNLIETTTHESYDHIINDGDIVADKKLNDDHIFK